MTITHEILEREREKITTIIQGRTKKGENWFILIFNTLFGCQIKLGFNIYRNLRPNKKTRNLSYSSLSFFCFPWTVSVCVTFCVRSSITVLFFFLKKKKIPKSMEWLALHIQGILVWPNHWKFNQFHLLDQGTICLAFYPKNKNQKKTCTSPKCSVIYGQASQVSIADFGHHEE
ncbi:hypothetical protein CLU79DRAFT_111664 [Phycomyces nitens]|nr:hypothetical protein CLU79DRAFT_111664 [Phycomyces nitens]